MIDVVVALVPVIVFLAALFLMDTFRLVRPSWIVAAIGLRRAGGARLRSAE